MEALLNNQDIIEKKNVLLQPLYRDIKSQIRHMTFTPEFEIMREYLSKRKQLENTLHGQYNKEETEKVLNAL